MTNTTTPTDLDGVLAHLGIVVAAVGEREISARCPFHPDNHPSFSMNADNGLWICYQCGQRGTLEMLVAKVSGTTSGTETLLKELKRASIGKKKSAPVVDEEINPFLLYAEYEGFRSPPAWALEERKIGISTCENYGVRWNKGWIIPIWSADSKDLWGWQFKRMDFVSNYPRAVKKSRTLFGLRELFSSSFALVESPLDVVRLAEAGVPAVATYGAFVSKIQIQLLIEHANRIVLALDNDEEGQRQTERIRSYIAKFIPTASVEMPEGCKDPGDMTNEQILRTFRDV